MKKSDRNALIALPIVILIGVGVALAGSQGGIRVAGLPFICNRCWTGILIPVDSIYPRLPPADRKVL